MATLLGAGQFMAPTPLTLVLPDGSRKRYRGWMRYVNADTVNFVPLDSYLKGVVPAEMPASWRRAALRAQVVAARTYALFERQSRLTKHWQLCDTARCQVYGGLDSEHPRTNQAVDLTPGWYLYYRGKPAFTQFNASSGGWTAAGNQPYLVAKKDPFDADAGNPVHKWTAKVDARRLEQAYPQIGSFVRMRIMARDGRGTWGGRVTSVNLVGSKGRVTVTGEDVRRAAGLRSSWFRIAAQ